MRQYLKSGAAAIALMSLTGAMMPAYAQDSDENDGSGNTFLHPYRGDINPFYGDINPFWGDINPFWGDINPFRGDINPFYGDISPFWGDINPFLSLIHI